MYNISASHPLSRVVTPGGEHVSSEGGSRGAPGNSLCAHHLAAGSTRRKYFSLSRSLSLAPSPRLLLFMFIPFFVLILLHLSLPLSLSSCLCVSLISPLPISFSLSISLISFEM